jgi:sialate O-acetylesterase
MHGMFINTGPTDWQIIQQEQGYGNVTFSGTYNVPEAAIDVGTEITYPSIRVLSEEDNGQIIPWTKTTCDREGNGMSGIWIITLTIPAGGLYRIETGLDTISTKSNLRWFFRGDVRLHIGIGDLFLVAGQSNSSGYGRDSALDPPDINVHLFRNRGTWDLACHPINESTYAAEQVNAEMGISGTSPYLSFGKVYHKLTQYPVGLITTGQGGSTISRWDVSQNGDLYRNMIERLEKCGNKATGILWYQGCSDTNPSASNDYYASFLNLVTETRKKLGYDIPFFTFQLNRQLNAEYNECWGVVREAQRQAANSIPKVYLLPTLHCSLCDGIHNNSHSVMMLGEAMAKLCSNVIHHHLPEYFAADISDAVYQDNIITLSFRNMRKGFLIINGNPEQSSFKVQDATGIIPISALSTDERNPNNFIITLERAPSNSTVISFEWESDPSHIPFFDEVTFMPPLSFYEFPVRRLQKQ